MKNSVFSIGIYRVCLIFKTFYWMFNISYFILSNSEDSQLQAKKTGCSVKNWEGLNSVINVKNPQNSFYSVHFQFFSQFFSTKIEN
jgi:hypothetical protein